MMNAKNKTNNPRRLIAAAMLLAAGSVLTGCEDDGDQGAQALIAGTLAAVQSKTLSSISQAYGDRYVTMKRVRYCRNWLCTKATTPSEFRFWENRNVDRGKQRETYIAVINPGRSNIENIVFFAAGQQSFTSGVSVATANVLTGQPKDYKKNCKGKCRSASRRIHGDSLAVYLMNQGKFSTGKTLYVLAFDAQFNHEYGSSEKNKIENAYYDYLVNNVDYWRIKRIILGGSSRGGALAFRLAKRFRGDWRYDTKATIVQGFDATFIKHQELGATTTLYTNPLNSSWKGRYTNISAQFPNRVKLALNQMVSGKEAVPLSGARGFVYRTSNVDYGWFKQKWVNIPHGDIGSNFAYKNQTVDYARNHINQKLAEFGL